MGTQKFKENLFSLMSVMDSNKFYDFMMEKEAFTDNFIDMICKSEQLTKITNLKNNKRNYIGNYNFDITKIDNDFVIGFDDKKNKIKVDITGNKIFSYYDDEISLRTKLDSLINDEKYEDADILYKFLKDCDIKYP